MSAGAVDSQIVSPATDAVVAGRVDGAGLSVGTHVGLPHQRLVAGGSDARKRRESIFRWALLAADVAAVFLAVLCTTIISGHDLRLTWWSVGGVAMLIAGVKLLGLYDRDDALLRRTTLEEAPQLLQVATLGVFLTWLSGGLVIQGNIDRREAFTLWVAIAALLIVTRTLARALALRMAPVERCLFIGEPAAAEAVRSRLCGGGGVRGELVGQIDLDKMGAWSTDARLGSRVAEVREMAKQLDVQRAIIAPLSADADGVLNLVRTLNGIGIRVSLLPRLLEVVGSSVEFDDLHGVTIMGVRRFEMTRSSLALKRCFDFGAAALGLLAIAPLMLIAAAAIKLDSRGPVFFRQLRVGRYGQRFHIYKFRTMVADAESMKDALRDKNEAKGGLFKIAEDPRVTRVGRLLRKTSLDELPQLLNILSGEMSLVGPRPLVVDEDERVTGWQRSRLQLTPGMTGPWQILGPARVPLDEMVAIDYLYVANWSLWADVKLLLRTVSVVVAGRGL